MQIKDLTPPRKNFQPVALQLTFESRTELVELWSRLNANNYTLAKALPDSVHTEFPFVHGTELYDLWDKIDELLDPTRDDDLDPEDDD